MVSTGNGEISSAPPRPLRLFLFATPRTASNLFLKLYSEHPDVKQIVYPFLYPHFSGPDSQFMVNGDYPPNEAEKAQREMVKHATYQFVLDKLEREIAEAESTGKVAFVKEHTCYVTQSVIARDLLERPRGIPPKPRMEDKMLDLVSEKRGPIPRGPYHDLTTPIRNPTVLPDRLLKTFAPVIIIRHPVKQIDSFYRASVKMRAVRTDDSEFEMAATFKFSRLIFDYFKSLYSQDGKGSISDARKSQWPIVVDGDDLINDTEGVARRFCAVTGLSPAGVIYKWGKTKPADPFFAVFLGTLNESLGVVKNKTLEMPSIVKSGKKWEEEWGPAVAADLIDYAEKAMTDYNYLYQYRL